MFKQLRNLYFIFAAVLLVGQASYALSTYYLHLTNHETTRFDEIIWFWTPDTMDGPVHSNDFIGLKYSPHFYEHVSTSQDHFLEYQPNPYFEFEPIFNAPRIEFPESFNHLRNNAHPLISSRNDLLMTWISMDGADGIDIFQYPMGTLRNDSLCMHLNVPHRQIIFVDGEVEVEGELAGQLTICSRGDMWLIDNCIYTGAHRQTGWFEENHMNHMLGLVSERNIIIEGNERNGLRNGWEENRGDHDRHSIVINGHLIALGESFTFEHQNDEWERYQGPTPDRRGYIYLKGSLAQYRRGYVHRANHGGTGYGKSYHWDSRLRRLGPPGFGPGENPAIQGRYDVLELGHISGYYILNASVGTLIIHSGVDVELRGNNPIVVRDRLIIRGSAEHPVTIHPRSPGARTTFRVERGSHSYVEMYYAHFAASIETRITCDTLLVSNCEFNGPANWSGRMNVDSSLFAGEASFTSWHELSVERCIFENGLSIAGNTPDGRIVNNTITGSRNDGVRLRRFSNIRLVNNIIAFNRNGIVNDHYEDPVLRYNDVFGNDGSDYVECMQGEGSISANPQFVNFRRGDYHLAPESACIDTGDPDSPRDADGTSADMGAFSYYQEDPDDISEPAASLIPDEFGLDNAYPNPFNAMTNIAYSLPVSSRVAIRVYDVTGQLVTTVIESEKPAGFYNAVWNGRNEVSGVYIVKMQAGGFSSARKIVLTK